MTTLSARSIRFGFQRDNDVIRDLSLDLADGDVLALLGGNGAGKTTLLRLLAGQLVPQQGEILLDDMPMQAWSRREIAQRVALMPQSERCEAGLTVREMVRLGRAAHRGWLMPLTEDDEQAVDEALRVTDMHELHHRQVTTLSGGQLQRAILARSLAQHASVLLLDEPTSGLDLKHQYDCLNQVRQLAKERNLIAVVSMHDLNQAAMFADRVALLADGQVLAMGDCESVFTEDLIYQTYGIRVTVAKHPIHDTPLIVPLCQERSPG